MVLFTRAHYTDRDLPLTHGWVGSLTGADEAWQYISLYAVSEKPQPEKLSPWAG